MTWRGSTNNEERIIACLPYLLPLIVSIFFGTYVLKLIPPLAFILIIILPLAPLATGIPGLVVFFLLYYLVVRNSDIKHFLRFNTMQALLIDIGLSIVSLILRLLNIGGSLISGSIADLVLSTLYSTLFLGTVAIVIFSWVMISQGKYPEVPVISTAAYYHTQY